MEMEKISKDIVASGAKSIMKKPGMPKNKTGITFGQCLIYEYDKDPENNQIAKRVDSKDISDMRDEKTKIRDMLQEKENEQMAQIKRMQAMMGQKEDKKSPEKFSSSSKGPQKIEDSIGESGSLSQSKGKTVTESYDTDTFEENSQSQSGSGKKQGLQYWPGKEAVEISGSVT